MRSQVFAKIVLISDDGKILLIKRSQTSLLRAGEWDLPGGMVEPGELVNNGIVRELFEETGMRTEPAEARLIHGSTEPYKDEDSNTRLLFTAKAPTTEVVISHEHDDSRWVDLRTAIEDIPHHIYREALRYAVDHNLLEQVA